MSLMTITTTSTGIYLVLLLLVLIYYHDHRLLTEVNATTTTVAVTYDNQHTIYSKHNHRDVTTLFNQQPVEIRNHPNLRLRSQLSSNQTIFSTNTTSSTTTSNTSSIGRQLEENKNDNEEQQQQQQQQQQQEQHLEVPDHDVNSGGMIHINDHIGKEQMISSISSELSLLTKELTDETCQKLSPMSDLYYTDSDNEKAFINYQHYSDFLEGPGISNHDLQYAVCEFLPLMYYQHYPHAMQQMLRCFSWFAGHPNLERVILWRNDTFFHNFITDNIVAFLQQHYGVKLMDDDPNHNYDESIVATKISTGLIKYSWDSNLLMDFAMLSDDHATEFKNLFYDNLRLHEDDPRSTVDMTTVGCTAKKRHPRIGILNRVSKTNHNKKFIYNDKEIYEVIHKAYPDIIVELIYFDELSYIDQIMKMMNVDIVLSTHGSQLQHLMFMPSQGCSSVIELIPPEFFIPDFYGSLCKVFHIQHSFFYMDTTVDIYDIINSNGTEHDTPYHKVISPYYKENIHFCVDTAKVLKAVSVLIQNWYSCCDDFIET